MPGRLAEAPDFGPLIAILIALLAARFLIWGRLTMRTALAAVGAGLLWSVAADRWGAPVPTLIALAVVWLLIRAVESAGHVDTDATG
jgi:hypothetical protein